MNNHQDSQNMRDLDPPLMKAVQAVLTETPPDDAVSRVLDRAKRLEVRISGGASEGVWNRLVFRLTRLTVKQRMVVGGFGLSALAAMILVFFALNSAGQLSAMERMLKELREVKSYSYKCVEHVTIVRKGKTEPGLVDLIQTIFWRAPGSLREELKIVLSGAVPEGYHQGQVDADIVGIYSAEQPGIFMDQLTKTYFRMPKLTAEHTGSGSLTYPMKPLRDIRELTGTVTRDLGTQEIHGKQAHGYMMAYKNLDDDLVELWLDPETDLPLEVGWETKDETTTSHVRMIDFRWNIDLDEKLFDPTPPAGYIDNTPPTDEKSLAQIAGALKLYARLSGGHYPQIDTYKVNAKFDADAIYAEMLKMARFAGPARPEWASDKKFLEIQQAKPGLDWIGRIVLSNLSGYHGSKVGPQDQDKPLLWWRSEEPTGYRVFYGDLHSELLTDARAEGKIAPHPKIFDAPAEDEHAAAEKH